ncbi:hypothetical protein B0T22DRAFT_463091 [Podospora appendiculata]|uniref:Uncharacterized protein n=1 Tax=Podospora appendiculata TaxID=314037 RepID=A0AAE0XCG7_9PEZI|nr:hypothetical protein B0T22DRAFT_463091 [Podospora appendiculata]
MWVKKIAGLACLTLLVSLAAAQIKSEGNAQGYPKKIKHPRPPPSSGAGLGLDLDDHEYDEPEYPKFNSFPTHKKLNDSELIPAVQCVSNWCEMDNFLTGRSGKVRCYTAPLPGSGERHVAFVCNMGKKATRCSNAHLKKSIGLLRVVKSSMSGYVQMIPGPGTDMEMAYGFDRYCEGGDGCGDHYDPVAIHCDEQNDDLRKAPFLYDQEVTPEYLIEAEQQNPVYEGISWANEPTASPTHGRLSYPTVTAT